MSRMLHETTLADNIRHVNRSRSNSIDPPRPPRTRYQGSKHKLLDWIWSHLGRLEFYTVLDLFGGSGCVSHFLKGRGKSVTFNDALRSSYLSGIALVENQDVTLANDEIMRIIERRERRYEHFISDTFHDIYFTPDENQWLDVVAQNIRMMRNPFKQAIAYYALFQSAMAKRPYNLFHRKNLYMRMATVSRTFGNKATWDKPFEEHFRDFVAVANTSVFRGSACRAINEDAANLQGEFDLVYIDPPYINKNGQGVDYHGFYHFLEGLADYPNWRERIDFESKHRRLRPVPSCWTNRGTIALAFADVFERHRRSILVVSYRSDGIPSLEDLSALMGKFKRNVRVYLLDRTYKYALSTNGKSSESLLVGTD